MVDTVAPFESYIPGKQMYRKEPWLPVSLLKNIHKQKQGCYQFQVLSDVLF